MLIVKYVHLILQIEMHWTCLKKLKELIERVISR